MAKYFSKTLWQSILALLILLVTMGAIVYRFAPALALDGLELVYRLRSGLESRSVKLDGYEIPYYTGGQGDPLLLVHGFGDSRMSFVQTARYLVGDYRVYIPDLPGFGDTDQDPQRSYSIAAQAASIKAFMDKMKIPKADLVGNSMGGHTSAYFAIRYPQYVHKLVLLNPAGLLVDDPIPYKPAEHPLRNEADFDAYLTDVFVNKPWTPVPFVKHFIASSQKNFKWLNHIRSQIRSGEGYILNKEIHKIQAPTLVFWGRQDGVINVVHAPVWHKGISNSKMVVWDDMGHAPQYEAPERTALLIAGFLQASD